MCIIKIIVPIAREYNENISMMLEYVAHVSTDQLCVAAVSGHRQRHVRHTTNSLQLELLSPRCQAVSITKILINRVLLRSGVVLASLSFAYQ